MTLVCAACDRSFGADARRPLPFRCDCPPGPQDRVLTPTPTLPAPGWRPADDAQPFAAWRALLTSHAEALAHGLGDAWFVDRVRALDAAVVSVDGAGFRQTPCAPLDLIEGAQVFAKDETGHVAGSHKARHLFGILLHLEVDEALGRRPPGGRLAIASCGNAALAAAVLARATKRSLTVFIPPDAHAAVVSRLEALGVEIEICRRRAGEVGDPCYRRFLEALDAGAVPFCCQGTANGLTLEGGKTLAWEMARALDGRAIDHLVVQVGGGALGSSLILGLREAVALGLLPRMPSVHVVQTTGAAPLARAIDRVRARAEGSGLGRAGIGQALRHAAAHKADYMWPWEQPSQSLATGILDDETHDWWRLCEGVLETGGQSVIVTEATLIEARARAHLVGVRASHTGAAGLAGALSLCRDGVIPTGARIAVVLSGVER